MTNDEEILHALGVLQDIINRQIMKARAKLLLVCDVQDELSTVKYDIQQNGMTDEIKKRIFDVRDKINGKMFEERMKEIIEG